MKLLLVASSIIAVMLTAVSVFLFMDSPSGNVSEGWTTYENRQVGFSVTHPQEMEMLYEQENVAAFVISVPIQEEDVFDGMRFEVTRQSLGGQTLQEIARQNWGAKQTQPVTIAGTQGYQYRAQDEYPDPDVWIIILPFSRLEYLAVSAIFSDPNSQGYEQTVQRMLDSFTARQADGLPLVSVILGIILVFGIIVSGGLLFISRRT